MNPNPNLKTPLAKSSLVLMWVMLIIIVASLVGSVLIFRGYLGGGRSAIGVMQAFLMCLGAGAILYVPAAVVFAMARSVRANGPIRKIGGFTALLAMPVWAYGGLALMYYPQFWIWGLLALTIGLYLSFWAVIVLKHCT
ncbi:MAG: hypothetical protein HKO02_00730 [Hyphomonadaceae bacterium]|nr:hypothetical protein [Hyphomonadaceae bacterium]